MMYMTIQRLHMKLLFEHILVWTIISDYCSVIFISWNDYECWDCLIKCLCYFEENDHRNKSIYDCSSIWTKLWMDFCFNIKLISNILMHTRIKLRTMILKFVQVLRLNYNVKLYCSWRKKWTNQKRKQPCREASVVDRKKLLLRCLGFSF